MRHPSEIDAPARLRRFIEALTELESATVDGASFLVRAAGLLQDLVSHDDWLDPDFAIPSTERYQQYLLYLDPSARFSVVSFVWGPGQSTPVHNHTVWGVVGVLRGGERAQSFSLDTAGRPQPAGEPVVLLPGAVEVLSPTINDIHQVSNLYDDAPSVSIHVYGADIGRTWRTAFLADGTAKPFISGYSNKVAP